MVGRKWPHCIQSMAQAVTHDREAHGTAGTGQMGRTAVGVVWEAKVEQGAKEHQVLALGPNEHGWGCGCGPVGPRDEARGCHWHGNGRGSLEEHAVNGCPCVREHGVGMYAAPDLWVSLWNAMEKPGLTSCDLGHDVTKGGAQSLRHVHGAPGLWVSLWTAMQKPGLTSCDLGHDVKKGGAQNLRHVHGAVERQACAWSWRPEPYACGRPSLFDAICVVTPRLTWKMSKRKRWGASSFCAHQVHCSERQQREWQAEEELAASMAWLAAMRSAVVHTAPCTVLCERRTASFEKKRMEHRRVFEAENYQCTLALPSLPEACQSRVA